MRQNRKRNLHNLGARTRLRHAVREMRRALAQNLEAARAALPQTVSVIDKAVKKGIIKENTGSRYKSRLMARLTATK